MDPSYLLSYSIQDGPWLEKPLDEGEFLIGRDPAAWLAVPHSSVSHHHARLRVAAGRMSIMDLGSTNGTQVDGAEIAPRQWVSVEPGQTITIGLAQLRPAAVQPSATVPLRGESKPAPAAGKAHAAGSLPPDLIPAPIVREEESQPTMVLRVQKPEGNWQSINFRTTTITIGRSGKNDFPIDHPKVSRIHAVLEVTPSAIIITDQHSTNGTFLNGQRLPSGIRQTLDRDTEIRIGPLALQAILPGEDAASPTIAVPGEESDEPGEAAQSPTSLFAPEQLPESGLPLRLLNLTTREKASIGRAADNNLVLNHPLVSRYHAVVERIGGRFRLMDLNSANGVFVNDVRVEGQCWMREGDRMQIGPYTFSLTAAGLQNLEHSGFTLRAERIRKQVSSSLNLLQNIDVEFRPREFVALVGMSGAGKTTLLDALCGYRPATHGQVTINNVDLYRHFDQFRTEIGYVPQRDIVHPELTPRLALDYAAKLRMPPDTSSAERETLVSEVLADLGLTERQNLPISRLSGGQIKRVSIGVELLTKPRLFFLDEPTSGLDPGTEYDMMKLLRRLADQGRTVLLVTHATKNVILCDKVVFMARGGYLAFFGPPDEALRFFDTYRTEKERREKEMEFDEIYRILNDPDRGTPEQWARRFQQKYGTTRDVGRAEPAAEAPAAPAAHKASGKERISSLVQFLILSERNLRILVRDRVSLLLMLMLAPGLGLLDFVWGSNAYDPVHGDAVRTMSVWFMLSIVALLVGSLSSVREIVKEADVYKRERTVGVRILPYVLSKIWVGIVLSLYQGGMLLAFRMWLVHPVLADAGALGSIFITVVLGTLCGYLLGLAISALAPNQNASMLLLIAVVVPQFLFAGVLLPLDYIPGGEIISRFVTTRWTFEAFVKATGVGDVIVADACWDLDREARLALTAEEKEGCACLGENIFETCKDFPGIRSLDFYDSEERSALAFSGPVKPEQPTSLPSPTSYPSPTSPPTPTAYSLRRGESMEDFMDRRESQADKYQDTRQVQLDDYRETVQAQSDEYVDEVKEQNQGYADDMELYGDDKADWERHRQKAISSAESVLNRVYDNYGQAFRGTVWIRWLALGAIMLGMFAIILVAQKQKDVV